jgi:hypothetical protein
VELRVHKIPPFFPILNQVNPVLDLPYCFFKIHFNFFLLNHSLPQGICLCPRPCVAFSNTNFYGEKLLCPGPSTKLEDHSLSDVYLENSPLLSLPGSCLLLMYNKLQFSLGYKWSCPLISQVMREVLLKFHRHQNLLRVSHIRAYRLIHNKA